MMRAIGRTSGPGGIFPALATARRYGWSRLRADLLAGLTVSVVELPQAMAYALIAGVPVQYGLYASIVQGAVSSMLSSSRYVVTGPTNTQSLLVASIVTRLADPAQAASHYLQLVLALSVLKGLMQIAMGAGRIGDLLRYVSRSVIVGLSAGAGVLIAVAQVPAFLGISIERESWLPGVPGLVHRMLPHLDEMNRLALYVGLAALGTQLLVRSISRLAPAALLAVVVGGLIVAFGGLEASLPVAGAAGRELPLPQLPKVPVADLGQLMTGALALAVIGAVEANAVAKSLAGGHDRISGNREFFAQGAASLLGGFLQAIPSSSSFTRSALIKQAGAVTSLSGVFNAGFVLLALLIAGDLARYISQSSLAAVLFVIACGLIDWQYLLRVARTSRSDLIVCLVTFVATLLAPLEYAVFIGIFVNIALYLRTASRLHMAEMVQPAGVGAGAFLERPLQDRTGEKQTVFLQLEGELFFAVSDELQEQLNRLADGQPRVVILRLKRTHSIDATVLHVMENFVRTMRARGRHVLLCGVRPELMTTIRQYGLLDLIGRDNVFEAGIGVFSSAKRAIQRARQIVGSSIDTRSIDAELHEEGPIDYAI